MKKRLYLLCMLPLLLCLNIYGRKNAITISAFTVVNKERKGNEKNDGTINPSILNVQSADITITNLRIICGNTFESYTYSLTVHNYGNNVFITTAIIFTSPGGSISAITYLPPAATPINPGTSVTFTGGFSYSGAYPAAVYATINGTQFGNTNLPSVDTEVDSIDVCVCDFCKKGGMNIIPGAGSSSYVPQNMAHILQDFTVTPNNIIKITAEIVYTRDNVTSEDCRVCANNENDVFQFITSNTISGFGSVTNPIYGSSSTVPPSKILTWISNNAAGVAINPAHFDLNIGLPATSTLDCCNQHDKICIRYTFRDVNCKDCSKMVCYQIAKKPAQPKTKTSKP